MLKVALLANWGIGVEILKTLCSLSNIQISLVVTRFDPRSNDPWLNVVLDYASKRNLPVLNQDSMHPQALAPLLRASAVDLLITHAYMHILPREIFSAPRLGTINVHASLLPSYRGPAPSYWVLKNRETITGLTCHFMDEGIDTGDIVYQVRVPVEPADRMQDLLERLKSVVEPLLLESLSRVQRMDFHPVPQDDALASYAPKPREKTR